MSSHTRKGMFTKALETLGIKKDPVIQPDPAKKTEKNWDPAASAAEAKRRAEASLKK